MIKLQKFLVIGYKSGSKATASITAKYPSVKANEIVIVLNMSLPKSLFTKPMLSADIFVPENEVSAPVIKAEVADDIAKVVQEQLGISMQIEIIN